MEWLDFILQAFVQGLAWCAAVVVTVVGLVAVALIGLRLFAATPLTRRRRRR